MTPTDTSSSSSLLPDVIDTTAGTDDAQPGQKRKASRPLKSDAWLHFRIIPGANKTKCIHCSHMCTYNGPSTGTKGMLEHLQVCPQMPGKEERGQTKLTFSGLTRLERERVDKAVAMWVIRDQQALQAPEHPALRAIFALLPGNYIPPSRGPIGRIIDELYAAASVQLANALKAVPGKVALTSDAWTAVNGQQYLGITGHYVDADWRLCSVVLDFPAWPAPHTAAHGAQTIEACLDRLGLRERISASVTDNASAALATSHRLQDLLSPYDIFCGRCAAHTINLIVKHALNDSGRDEILQPCRRLVTLLHHSAVVVSKLQTACQQAGVSWIMPPTEIEVRWSSTLRQVQALVRIESGIKRFFQSSEAREYASYRWDQATWTAMHDLCKILAPFDDLTAHLQGQTYPTLSTVSQGFVVLEKDLTTLQTPSSSGAGLLSGWGTAVVDVFLLQIKSYKASLVEADYILWASLLDPSIKRHVVDALYADDPLRVDNLISRLTAYVQIHYEDIVSAPASSTPLSEYHKRLQNNNMGGWSASQQLTVAGQLTAYLAEPHFFSPAPNAIFQYWHSKASIYPQLAQFARDVHAIPATSAPSETVFSRSGELISKRRNRLTGDSVTKIMCLDSWLQSGIHSE